MSMKDDIDKPTIRYDLLVESALRMVVRDTLKDVEKNGLPGEHHFYVTFNTQHPKIVIPDYLREGYDTEMTIVLQYEFYDLKIYPDKFSVTLSFDDVLERLEIPFAAITSFADPSVNFALQFNPIGEAEGEEDEFDEFDHIATDILDEAGKQKPVKQADNNVVALDAFRKKQQKK